jgi:outer membrane protein
MEQAVKRMPLINKILKNKLFSICFIKQGVLYRMFITSGGPLKKFYPPLLLPVEVGSILFLFILSNTVEAGSQTENAPGQIKQEVSFGALYGTSSLLAEGLARSTAAPFVDIALERGRFFASLQRGIGYGFVRTHQLRVDAALGYRAGRSDNKDDLYRGLGNVKGALLALVSVNWEPSEALYLYASASQAINGPKGVSLIIGAGVGFPVLKRLNGYVDVSGTWGDGTYVQTYYGITPGQAERSGYRPYTPGAGVVNTTVIAGLVYDVSTKWAINFAAGATRFEGDVQKSPMVVEERVQPVAHLYVTHRF